MDTTWYWVISADQLQSFDYRYPALCPTSEEYVPSSCRRRHRFWCQLLSYRAWTTATHSWLACLQLIQNATAWLVYNVLKFSLTTPLHWPLTALLLAYSAVNGSGPSYIQDMVKQYTPAHPSTCYSLTSPSRVLDQQKHDCLLSWLHKLSTDSRTAGTPFRLHPWPIKDDISTSYCCKCNTWSNSAYLMYLFESFNF